VSDDRAAETLGVLAARRIFYAQLVAQRHQQLKEDGVSHSQDPPQLKALSRLAACCIEHFRQDLDMDTFRRTEIDVMNEAAPRQLVTA